MRASTSVVFALGHRRCTLAIDRPSAVSSIFVILKFKLAHLNHVTTILIMVITENGARMECYALVFMVVISSLSSCLHLLQ